MEERQITITFEKAKEWYNSDNATLKYLALQAFTEEELRGVNFTEIKSFEDALDALGTEFSEYKQLLAMVRNMSKYSKASAAMFKLNIIRKALNKNYELHLTKNVDGQSYTWYPYFRLAKSTYLRYDNATKIGVLQSEETTYNVFGGMVDYGFEAKGLGAFCKSDVGTAYYSTGFLGCATKEIAKHFGKYFGMLIMEAMYGDIANVKIIN